jgi:hypothetical protein
VTRLLYCVVLTANGWFEGELLDGVMVVVEDSVVGALVTTTVVLIVGTVLVVVLAVPILARKTIPIRLDYILSN